MRHALKEWAIDYGGCRSWIDLNEAIAPLDLTPVVTDETYHRQADAIHSSLTQTLT
jgi:hypothetical protein